MHRIVILLSILLITSPLFAKENAPPDSTRAGNHLTGSDKWLAKDKADHFMSSAFLIGLGYYAAKKELNFSDPASRNIAVGFSFSLGIAKEIYDGTFKKGTPSFKDLIADLLGAGFGYLVINLGR